MWCTKCNKPLYGMEFPSANWADTVFVMWCFVLLVDCASSKSRPISTHQKSRELTSHEKLQPNHQRMLGSSALDFCQNQCKIGIVETFRGTIFDVFSEGSCQTYHPRGIPQARRKLNWISLKLHDTPFVSLSSHYAASC